MANVIQGMLTVRDEKFCIIVSIYKFLTKLLSGALDELIRHGVNDDNIEQAIERAGTKAGNKGSDAAETAIEMVDLMSKMEVDCD